MLFLQAHQLKCMIKDRIIFDIPELKLYKGDRIGLVGKNGVGKSLLFKGLIGEFEVDAVISWYGSFTYVKQLDSEYANSSLSGGEQTLKRLEEAFAAEADILLLDEPTNHLDWKRIEDLENRLMTFKGAFVIVSHDRSLLDKVCTEIWEIADGRLTSYKGNYSFYEEEKKRQWELQNEAYEKYEKEKQRLLKRYRDKQEQAKGMTKPPSRMGNSEWQLYKNKASAKKGKIERVAKVVKERLDRLEEVKKPVEPDKIILEYLSFTEIHRSHLIMTPELSKSFSQKKLYTTPRLTVTKGSKTAIIGPNGCGKTTLLKQIFSNDGVELAQNLKIGFFEQQLEHLPTEQTVLDYLSHESTMSQTMIRTVLGRLRLKEDDVKKKMKALSGGERVKAAFAKLVTTDYNLLVLDEPTNHLDIDAIEAVEDLLLAYPGTVLFTSHDRRFVDQVADHLWIFHNETVEPFTGTILEWNQRKNQVEEKNPEEKLLLETRLTELISRLSMPSPKDDVATLDREYQQILEKLKLM
ncbi:macrolide transport system ATP-binding/permease protein [Bacillus oleivorans]|uniref:Macrolide transport system ATP-binding/permease protein n=1 Tax=Bacillus oleivorans TaxID=1448271 RepID=A0A285D5V4_9BACI|nr:ABC-F family ATP-binding cassette domain-containing protein [Bacillus oleivorans]SNX75197.1 macrolide transport system ATP-binding/permease protein [Bacillus oleivorans]